MKTVILRYLGLLLLAGSILAADQWTKALLRSRLALGDTWTPPGWPGALFSIVRTQNSGAAFSMGSGLGPLFMAFAIATAVAILVYYPRLPEGVPLLRPAVGLLLGGTLGNLADRLTVGQVTDFIAIRYFAVVNIADICITFGTILVVLGYLIVETQSRKKTPPDHGE